MKKAFFKVAEAIARALANITLTVWSWAYAKRQNSKTNREKKQ